jgi:hypothetical protein
VPCFSLLCCLRQRNCSIEVPVKVYYYLIVAVVVLCGGAEIIVSGLSRPIYRLSRVEVSGAHYD